MNKPPWFSSYEQNNYGDFFYSLMRIYKPKKVVELGTKAGFSAYHIARGLKDNRRGRLYCYDLWENYQFNSVPLSIAKQNLKKYEKIIRLNLRDVINIDKIHDATDILHIDLGNEGGILEKIIPNWINKTNQIIIIEGGSEERDQVSWMSEYNKIPIRTWLKKLSEERKDVDYFTIEPFPSITLLYKTHK